MSKADQKQFEQVEKPAYVEKHIHVYMIDGKNLTDLIGRLALGFLAAGPVIAFGLASSIRIFRWVVGQ